MTPDPADPSPAQPGSGPAAAGRDAPAEPGHPTDRPDSADLFEGAGPPGGTGRRPDLDGAPTGSAPDVDSAGAAAGAGAAGAADPEARRARAMRAARGALAGALMLEAIAVLFVPRAIAPLDDGPGLTGGRLAVLLTLAGLLLVASGLQRSRAGLIAGSVLQVAVIATGVLLPAMYVLGLVFAAAWLYLLKVRADLARATAPPPP